MSRDGPLSLTASLDAARVGDLQQDASPLARLARQARLLHQIELLVHEHLPSSARPHVAVAGIDRGVLRLLCRSAAWATRIRYSQKQMLRALESQQPGLLRHIEVTVRPAAPQRRDPTSRRGASLSSAARDHLQRAAEDEGDTDLGRALKHLARHAR